MSVTELFFYILQIEISNKLLYQTLIFKISLSIINMHACLQIIYSTKYMKKVYNTVNSSNLNVYVFVICFINRKSPYQYKSYIFEGIFLH